MKKHYFFSLISSLALTFLFSASVFAEAPGFGGIGVGSSQSGGQAHAPSGGGPTGICCYPGNTFITEYENFSLSYSIKYNTDGSSNYPYSADSNGIITLDADTSIHTIAALINWSVRSSLDGVVDSGSTRKTFNIDSLKNGTYSSVTAVSYAGDAYRPVYRGYYANDYCDENDAWHPGYTGYVGWCNSWTEYGDPLHFTISLMVYRNAEAVFSISSSLETSVDPSDGGTKSLGDRDAARNYAFSADVTSFFVDNKSSESRTFYMKSDPNYKFDATFSHTIYRGLNTYYESYIAGHQAIDSPWTVIRTNLAENRTGYARSLNPPAFENEGKTSLNNLIITKDTSTNKTTIDDKFTIKNSSVELGHGTIPKSEIALGEKKDFCENTSHPAVVIIGPNDTKQKGSDQIKTSLCASVHRPWNFKITPEITFMGDSDGETPTSSDNTLFPGGDEKEIPISIRNDRNDDSESKAEVTKTPNNQLVKVFLFTLSEDSTAATATTASMGPQHYDTRNINQTISSSISASFGGTVLDFKQMNGREQTDTFGSKFSLSYNDPNSSMDGAGTITIKNGINYNTAFNNITAHLSVSESADAGTKYCIVAAANYDSSSFINNGNGSGYGPASLAENRWVTSAVMCRTTAIKPIFQILGGDVYAGGSIDTATSTARGISFGSWVDYGLIVNGSISNLSSASFGSHGRDAGNTICGISGMSIANAHCKDRKTVGNSSVAPSYTTVNNLIEHYASSNGATGVTVTHLDTPTTCITYDDGDCSEGDPLARNYQTSDNIKDELSKPDGTQVIYAKNGSSLYITKNLIYSDGPYLNPSDIPQRIIIVENGDIVINHNVTRIDAWLVAKNGKITTCVDDYHPNVLGKNAFTSRDLRDDDICSNRLVLNGVTLASYIEPYRTFFSPSTADTPNHVGLLDNYAERFQLPYSALIWSHVKSSIYSISQPSMTYIRKLPPRY